MQTATTDTKQNTHIDVNTKITGRFTDLLGQGIIPWQKFWGDSGPPTNLITGHPYTGINALLLNAEQYEQNLFLSFDQANSLGGKIKKNMKGHPVVYWREVPGADGVNSKWQMDYRTVFNIAQCEIPADKMPKLPEPPAAVTFEYILAMQNCPKVHHDVDTAYYDVVEDVVHMPKKMRSRKSVDYYATLLLQVIHSTGHDSRLARTGVAEMSELADTALYSKEDLVAQIGMGFFLSMTGGTGKFTNGPGPAEGWMAKLKSNERMIISAANDAQKAVDYILNVKDDPATKRGQ